MGFKKNIISSALYRKVLRDVPLNIPIENPSLDTKKNVQDESLTHLSLCSGYGGIDIGMSKSLNNLKTIAYCEQDAIRIANLISKMELGWLEPAPIWTNLEDFPIDDFIGSIDVVSGGIPCQPFSVAGLRNAEESEKFLFPKFSECVQKLKPKFFMIENVDGLRSAKFKPTSKKYIEKHKTPFVLLYMLRDLENLGYRVHFRLETATRVGLPQERKRIFIIGIRVDLDENDFNQYLVDKNLLILERSPHSRSNFQYPWESSRLIEKQ